MVRFGGLAAVALLVGWALAFPATAGAHALLQTSDPAAGSTVSTAPSTISLTFGEEPDPGLSSVKVLDVSGRNVANGPLVAAPGSSETLRIAVGTLPDGVYTVSWRTVSLVDGHAASGSFAFGVGVEPEAGGSGPPAAPTSPSGSASDIAARFALLGGLVLLVGVGFVGSLVIKEPVGSLRSLAIAGWFLAGGGTLAVVVLQAIGAGSDPRAYLASALGAAALRRVIVTGIVGAVLGLAVRGPSVAGRRRYAVVAGGGLVLTLVDVMSGHAAANGILSVDVLIQWVHLVTAGVWIGGLASLLLAIRGNPSESRAVAARRFSRWAAVALVAVAVTGVLRAVSEVGTIEALTSSDFGRVVIAKSAFFVVLGGLGAVNRFGTVPRALRTLVPLRRVVRLELAVGAVLLVLTGLLVNLPPPASYGPGAVPVAVAPLTIEGHDFGTSVRVRLAISPGVPGTNTFHVEVDDFDTGDPAPIDGVTLRFAVASATGIGESTLALTQSAPGRFDATGTNLSLDGIWKITAVVALPSGAIEVGLLAATRLAAMAIDENAVEGLPTIFTAHLPSGDTLQVYLDPGTPGPNTLHATFFDATGQELPVDTAAFLFEPAAGPSAILPGRALDPGHYVVDVTLDRGPLGVDVVAQLHDGSTLHARFAFPSTP